MANGSFVNIRKEILTRLLAGIENQGKLFSKQQNKFFQKYRNQGKDFIENMFYSITTTWKWKVMVMNQIIKYIELHLEDDLTIKQLADVAGYSEYYFIRVFKSYTNQTVMEYICRRRLIKSCDDI